MTNIENIKNVPVFSGLSAEKLSKIADICKEEKVEAGNIVIYQGETTDNLNIVVNGSLEVDVEIPGVKDFIPVATLKQRDYFGELAFIDSTPRSATVKSLEKSVVISLSRKDFNSLVKEDPDIELVVMKNLTLLLSRKLRDTTIKMRDGISKLPSRLISRKARAVFDELAGWIRDAGPFSS